MDSLQIQDGFEPYYSDMPTARESKVGESAEPPRRGAVLKIADVHERLCEVRNRLATALNASKAA